jgi:sugar phosphate isomerase/epimerase
MGENDFEKRGRIVLDAVGNYPIKHLVYHYPLKFPFKDFDDMLNIDLAGKRSQYILGLTEDTIKEAGYVCAHLKLRKVFVVVHNIGFVPKNEINIELRNKKMALGEKNLRELAKIAKSYSDKFGCEISLVRENNPPDQGYADGLLDFDPRDLGGTIKNGININIDLAHLWMYTLYRRNGKGELPGAGLSGKVYPEFDPVEEVRRLAPLIRMLHLNDAGPGYTSDYEGIEIGMGDLPHKKIIEAILENAGSDIVGTYEIKNGHIDPETMYRSDFKYREIFGEKFYEYFD